MRDDENACLGLMFKYDVPLPKLYSFDGYVHRKSRRFIAACNKNDDMTLGQLPELNT